MDLQAADIPVLPKRSYVKRTPLCRLCLQKHPKENLDEIFTRKSDWKKRIARTVGVKPLRTDRSTRLCLTCQAMVELIDSFQQMCQQTEALLGKGQILEEIVGWKRVVKSVQSLQNLVEQCRNVALTASEHGSGSAVDGEEDDDGLMVEIETKQEVFEVTMTEGQEELAEEDEVQDKEDIKQEAKEPDEDNNVDRNSVHSEELEVKLEDDEDGDLDPDLEEYNPESDDQPTEEEEEEQQQEEDVKPPKKKRGRKKSTQPKNSKSEKVMCDTCGELISQVCLEGHLNRHRGVKPFACEVEGCTSRLYSKYSLQQHRHMHKSLKRYYDCPDCGKRIKGTNCWMRHRKMHTEDPKHQCDVCGKKFRRKFNLKLHSVVHTGVALYPCEICGKHFTVKHNLGAHYKTHIKNGTYPGVSAQQQQQHNPPRLHALQVESVQEEQEQVESVQQELPLASSNYYSNS